MSPWTHRFAVALACATFPLIWVGGLVTTYDAGMAVPDWPTTYGYNLFLYPLSTWFFGPWDLFIEHGHRLLGAAVGLIAIGLLVVAWRCDPRTWFRWATVAALVLVIFQGLLGGQRVVRDSRQIAQLHGIVGPSFFALALFLAAASSNWWRRQSKANNKAADYLLPAWMLAAMTFVQLVLGSNLRHVDFYTTAGTFSAFLVFHIGLAIALFGFALMLGISAWRQFRDQPFVARLAATLSILVSMQLLLGFGAWVTKYGWPSIISRFGMEANLVVQVESLTQAMVSTGHVACGALILAISLTLAASVTRLASLDRVSNKATNGTRDIVAGGIV